MSNASLKTRDLPPEIVMRKALADRDATYDDTFLYGVITTGVYCRPSCASRPAKPGNVRFYANAVAAEAAGLRACKRCQPNATQDRTVRRVQLLAEYIARNADQPLTLVDLAKRLHMSPSHLQRTFKAVLKAEKTVLEATTDAGFQGTSRIYSHASRSLGMTPSAYRRGGLGETIWYATRTTDLGLLLMGATDRGVCFAQFGESDAALVAQLQKEFPQASIVMSSKSAAGELDAWVTAFEAHVAAGGPRPELPLDLRGTAFQIRVWRFLLKIPEGEVVSYAELAKGIGTPKAVRAAASACAANRIAVLVPCHRVLRGDGGLGGYRWGIERKRVLIDRERARRAL